MTKTEEQIRAALAKGGEHIGDIVFTELQGVADGQYRRSALRHLIDKHGLAYGSRIDGLCEDKCSPQFAFGRALSHADVAEPYFTSRPNKRSRDGLLMKRTGKGTATKDVTHAVLTIGSGERIDVQYGPEADDGAMLAASIVVAKYNWHRDYIDHAELGSFVVRALNQECFAVRLRQAGGLYFVPESRAVKVRALADVVSSLGGSRVAIVPVNDTEEGVENIARSMTATFLDEVGDVLRQLQKLQRKMDSGKDVRRASVVRRLGMLEELRVRAQMVQKVLGAEGARIERQLKQAEVAVAQTVNARPDWADLDDEEVAA